MLLGVGFPTVGAIIASRRTHNPIGWLLCAVGLVLGVVMFASEYAIYALLVAPGSLPTGETVVLGNPLWVLGFNLIVLMLILFPTGRLSTEGSTTPERPPKPSPRSCEVRRTCMPCVTNW